MTFNKKTKDKKLQYDVNRGTIKALALSSAKIDKMNILKVKKHYLLV